MVASPPKPEPYFVQPVFTCFFEQAEYFLESVLPTRERINPAACLKEIIAVHQGASQIPVNRVDAALDLKPLQRRVRLGMMLQQELVDTMDKLTLKLPGKAELPV